MHRLASLVSVVVVLIGLAAFGASRYASAQEATPVPEGVSAGFTFEPLAFGAVPFYPPEPAEIGLARLRIEPGGRLITPADDPALGIIYVESGTLTLRNTARSVVTRATQEQEEIPAETEFTLSAGDSYVGLPMSGGDARNEGTEEVSILIGFVAPLPAGTPTP